DDRAVQDRAGPDARPGADQRLPDPGARFDHRALQDGAAVDARALADDGARPDDRAAGELGVRGDVGVLQDETLAAAAGDGRGGGAAQDGVGGAADECLGGAQVEPVGGVDHALEVGAFGEQSGEGLAFDGDGPPGRDGVDHRPVEDIGARVDLVGDDLLGG